MRIAPNYTFIWGLCGDRCTEVPLCFHRCWQIICAACFALSYISTPCSLVVRIENTSKVQELHESNDTFMARATKLGTVIKKKTKHAFITPCDSADRLMPNLLQTSVRFCDPSVQGCVFFTTSTVHLICPLCRRKKQKKTSVRLDSVLLSISFFADAF